MFLAGDLRMPLVPVLALTAVGLLVRISFTLWLGEVLAGPLDAVLGFIAAHQWEMTALTFALTVFHVVRHRRHVRGAATTGPPGVLTDDAALGRGTAPA